MENKCNIKVNKQAKATKWKTMYIPVCWHNS